MTRRMFEHWREVQEMLNGLSPIWMGIDFDGTLTHHQDDPSTVILPAEMRLKLERLAESPRFVLAVISGRSLADLMPRVGLAKLAYSGNHGMEIESPGLSWVDEISLSNQHLLSLFAEQAEGSIGHIPGTRIENKGLSLAIDYRPCSLETRYSIVASLNAIAEAFPSLRLRHAVYGSEVLPPMASHKGTAAQRLRDHQLRGEGIAIYLGDDLTDEDAFLALPNSLTIHVGERETAARFRVESADSVGEFLDRLLDMSK